MALTLKRAAASRPSVLAGFRTEWPVLKKGVAGFVSLLRALFLQEP
jgi:hypothetical protein